MDSYTDYVEVCSNFKVSQLCLKTTPFCHHYIKLDKKDELWNATKIYIYCKDNQINIPNHFSCIESL